MFRRSVPALSATAVLAVLTASGTPAQAGPPGEGTSTSTSPVAVASNQNGTLELFEAFPGRAIVHRTQTATGWGPWVAFDGFLTSVAAATTADGRVQVFGFNDSGDLWTRWQQGPNGSGGWDGWFRIQHLPTTFTSIAVAPGADGRLTLIYVVGGVMFSQTQVSAADSATWTTPQVIGTSVPADVVAAHLNANGLVEIVGRVGGTFQWRVQTSADSATYTDWTPIPYGAGPATGTRITLGRDGSGALETVFLTADGDVHLNWEQSIGTNAWATGGSFDGFLNSAALGTLADGRLELFGTNSSGTFWTKAQRVPGGGTGWGDWVSLDPPVL